MDDSTPTVKLPPSPEEPRIMMCFTTDGTEGYKVHEIMDIGKPAQLRFQIQLRKRAKDGTLYQLRFLNERGSDIAVVQICDGGAEAAQSITGSSFNGKKHTSVDDDDQWLYLQDDIWRMVYNQKVYSWEWVVNSRYASIVLKKDDEFFAEYFVIKEKGYLIVYNKMEERSLNRCVVCATLLDLKIMQPIWVPQRVYGIEGYPCLQRLAKR